jgi:hypothetical protein
LLCQYGTARLEFSIFAEFHDERHFAVRQCDGSRLKRKEGMHYMTSMNSSFGNEGFDPHLIQVMTRAFDDCRDSIPATMDRATMEELMAKYIIDLVRRGVHDPIELCADAKKRLGIA